MGDYSTNWSGIYRQKKHLFSLMFLLFTTVVFSQKTVTGTVIDEQGLGLPGVSILEEGTPNGTITDLDGVYSLTIGEGSSLTFSFVGYKSQTIVVGNQSNIDLSLEPDAAILDEIVVTGYSTQTRGEITGSVSSVDINEAIKAPVVNAAEALQGRVTGVQVVTTGDPGAAPKINIRGFGTSNNTNPLYIIDGVQTDDPNTLNNLNPNDIDQMNVIKDGAAAIYGARASNGVVIITTKNGGYGMTEPEISLDVYTGYSEISNSPGVLNPQQHAEMIWQSQINDGLEPGHPQYGNGSQPVVPSSVVGYTRVASYDPIVFAPVGEYNATVAPGGTNWIDAITRKAPVTNVSFSVANGTSSGKYYLSASYLKRDGIIDHTGFERAGTKLNSEFKINNRMKVGEHLNLSFSNSNPVVAEAVENAFRMTPLLPVMDDQGNFTGVAGPGLSNTRNPAAQLYRTRNDYNKRLNIFGDVFMTYEFIDGLTFKTTLAGGFKTFDRRAFNALDPEHGEPISSNTLTEEDQTATNWNWTNTLNYRRYVGDHSINAVVGIEALEERDKGRSISRQGYLFENPDFYLLNNGSGNANVGYAYDGTNTLFSVFGTVNYSFADKYYGTATLRRDKSSRFLGDNKSDIFPSFSLGWELSNEDFFPRGSVFSRVKLRGSWGELGNQSLPANNPTVNISGLSEPLANYSFDGIGITQGALLTQVGNPNLRWETSQTLNIGLDLALFNNKFDVALDVFNIKTKDLITRDFGLISSTAIDAGAPLVNLGDIKNSGFDLALGYSNRSDGGLGYNISVNLSKYKNEVTNLINDAPVAGRGDIRNGAVTRTEVGEEISYFYGRNVTGLDNDGRFVYEDVNGDGTVNDDDRTKIGSPHPDFIYGINAGLNYKGFDASLFFTGSQGNDVYNYNKVFTDFGLFFNGNRSTRVLDAWTPSNTDTDIPALTTSYPLEEASANSYFVEDGSYFRLRNVQLGYTLSGDLTDKVGIGSVRLYVQATNLFTLTSYEGYDPEVISYDNLSLGIDSRVYPISKVFTFGANIKF